MNKLETPFVVDSHVHVFSPETVQHREKWLSRDVWFESLYANPRALLVSADMLIETMDAAGVDHAVMCGFPWASLDLCREHNDLMADAARQYPGRLSWLGIVPPAVEGAGAEARRCLEMGAAGLGELNADAQGFDWRDCVSIREVVETCIADGRPLLLHASEPLGHHYPGKGTATPDKVLSLCQSFPELLVVAAHWGGGLPFHELMPEVAKATANVVYDCGASTYLYNPQVFRSVLDIVGPGRVLFGSDYPVLRMDRFLARVRQVEWRNEDEASAVLGGNAQRVFGIIAAGGEAE